MSISDIIKNINNSDDIINYINNLSIQDIENIINYCADKYYNKSQSVISDLIYDMLIDFLKLKNPKSKTLKNIGSKIKGNNKSKLDYWLGSMDKIKPFTNQLDKWISKYNPPYNISDKLDGVSALLIYNNNNISLYTRGTAIEGMNISKLIKYIDIPDYKSIYKYCTQNNIIGKKNMIAIRGELIIKKKTFADNWNDKMKNTRNTVSGLINSKIINPLLAIDTDLVVYEIIEPLYTINKQLDILSKMNFNVVYNKTINNILSYDFLSEILKKRRIKSLYDIDGIIITNCNLNNKNINGNPEYAFAYKDIIDEQIAQTTVISIEWNISKNGTINPTLLVEPIIIGGVEIKRCTGYNAKFIVDNILGPGSIIEIIRSGDVIPNVKKVISCATLQKPLLPNYKWHWNDTKIDIILDNINNNSKVNIKKIYFFFSTLNAKGLGLKTIEKIVESGLNTVPKILFAKYDNFINIDSFKDKTINNLLESIKKCLIDISLVKLMAASSLLGNGIGEEKIKLILNIYPNILEEYIKWTKPMFINKLNEINGWDTKTSTLFVNNFPKFIIFYNSIKELIIIKNNNITTVPILNSFFENKIFVFSGFRDAYLENIIINNNGKINNSISKKTNYLIIKDNIDNQTEKINKAMQLNITILTKNELLDKIKK